MPVHRFLVLSACVLLVGVIALLLRQSSIVRTTPLESDPADHVGYYTGLALHDGNGILGKSYHKILVKDWYSGSCEVDIEQSETSRFKCYDSSGKVIAQGLCIVDFPEGHHGQPAPRLHNVWEGEFYSPDGGNDTVVASGTGVQSYWFPNGQIREQLTTEAGHWKELKRWYDNGQIREKVSFAYGNPHGKYTSYFRNGQLHELGKFDNGVRVGEWVEYSDTGESVKPSDGT